MRGYLVHIRRCNVSRGTRGQMIDWKKKQPDREGWTTCNIIRPVGIGLSMFTTTGMSFEALCYGTFK